MFVQSDPMDELMHILGINFVFHDTSACIVSNGELVVAIEEERLSCEKHTQKFPINSINKCLQVAGLDISDIDHITVSIQPKKHLWSKVFYAMSLTTKASSFIEYEFLRIRSRNNDLLQWYKNISGKGKRPKLHYMDHHMSHIGGSYFVSPFNKAALLSVDGWGEWATSWLGYGEGLNLTHFRQSKFPHSLGAFYSACTEFCGFKPNYDEGKTMGLAPMGNPETFYSIIAKMVRISPDGDIELDLSFFDFQNFTGKFCSNKFYEVFGDPRGDGEDFADNHLDTAAAFQKVLEEKIIDLCNVLESKTETDCLVIAGGVALNSVVNGRLLRDTRFKNIYVMPGAGDNGTCIGAAYYLYNGILQNSKRAHHDNAFIGTEYPNDHIQTVLDECKLNYYKSAHVCKDTAKLLYKGKIVGWFQGRMEFGPRSLGNRSILANPTINEMKDKINAEVKHREPYRPFAPSILSEKCSEYFDIDVASPFMLKVCDVKEDKQHIIPAITHVDGTARLQTVHSNTNSRYYELIEEFGKLSGVPVILNTSFNIMGESIVENPIAAIRCFFSTGLDSLVIGDYIINKNDNTFTNEGTLSC